MQVTYWDRLGRQHRSTANLEDISASGLCLVSEVKIPEDTRVSVHHGDGELIGTVRYCAESEIGLLLGIEFEPGCKWSTKHFQPEHLLDPRRLCETTLVRRRSENAGIQQ